MEESILRDRDDPCTQALPQISKGNGIIIPDRDVETVWKRNGDQVTAVTAETAACETAAVAAEGAFAKLNEGASDAKSKSSAFHTDVVAAAVTLQSAKDAQSSLDAETEAASARKLDLEAISTPDGPTVK